MPAPTKATTEDSVDGAPETFSLREQRFLLNAYLCMETLPNIDMDALAARIGLGNPRSAQNIWYALRKKIEAEAEKTGRPVPATPATGKRGKAGDDSSTPATTGKRKAVAGRTGDETPTKKRGRGRPAKNKVEKKVEASDMDLDDDEAVQVEGNVKVEKMDVKMKVEECIEVEGVGEGTI